MLSPRYLDLSRRSGMWEDALKSHVTQSKFRIIGVSTEVFQTMQSLPSDDNSAQSVENLKDEGQTQGISMLRTGLPLCLSYRLLH